MLPFGSFGQRNFSQASITNHLCGMYKDMGSVWTRVTVPALLGAYICCVFLYFLFLPPEHSSLMLNPEIEGLRALKRFEIHSWDIARPVNHQRISSSKRHFSDPVSERVIPSQILSKPSVGVQVQPNNSGKEFCQARRFSVIWKCAP